MFGTSRLLANHWLEKRPYFIFPNFVFSAILHTFCRCLPNAHKKNISQILHYFIWSPHKHKTTLYCIHTNKKHYEHTSYPTHLKLTVKIRIMHMLNRWSPTVNMLWRTNWYFSVFKLNDNACTPSMMDDATANCILFIQKAKCFAALGIWIEQCSSCSRNLGFKRPDLKIWKNVVMDYFNAPSLDLTWGKQKPLPVGWHIWSRQDLKMLHLKYHCCCTFMTFHQFIVLEFNYV